MFSRLTVAEVRANHETIVTTTPGDAEFLVKLNEVTERILADGAWVGTKASVQFDASTGYITLPRRYEAILGCTVNCCPRGTYGRYHEFIPGGPGFYDLLTYDHGLLLDQGDFPTTEVQTEIGLVRLTIANAADANKVVRVYGTDADGKTIFDSTGAEGVALTLANPTVTSSVSMWVTAVSKVATLGNVTLSIVGAATTELSVYEPTETNPMYRRYKCGTITAREDETPAIRTLCKRRWIKLAKETDFVYPGNLGALKMGLQAVMLEESGDDTQIRGAEVMWGKCWQLLNAGLKNHRGNVRPLIPYDPGVGRMRQVR